jgi:hypothetical protein
VSGVREVEQEEREELLLLRGLDERLCRLEDRLKKVERLCLEILGSAAPVYQPTMAIVVTPLAGA